MDSIPSDLSPLRLPRGEIVFYPTGRPSIRVLIQQIAALGYEVSGFPLHHTDLRQLPPGVWHCAVVIGKIILFVVDPTEPSASDLASLTSGYGSSSHNEPDLDNVDPDYPEDGYVAPLKRHSELINIDEHPTWDPTNAKGRRMVPESIDMTLNHLCLSLIRLNRGNLLGDIQLLQKLGYCLVGEYLPPFVVEVCRDLITGCVRMGKKKDHKVDHVRTNDLRTRRIAGTMMWANAARPRIEGHLGSDGLLPRVPFFKVLLLTPDGVTG
jgi:hypothetical protein